MLCGVVTINKYQQSIEELISSKNVHPKQPNDSVRKLELLKQDCFRCSKCDLRKGCQRVVFGDGEPRAKLMLVGEGPGADEDRLGIPFVGRAGQLLDRILSAAEINREDIYITNIVKCRPPSNRLPLQSEVDACLPYLEEQIKLIDPLMVVCLGSLSARTLIDNKSSITKLRGQIYQIGKRKYLATFHPAALLRDPGKKKFVWEDFKQIISFFNQEYSNGGSNDE